MDSGADTHAGDQPAEALFRTILERQRVGDPASSYVARLLSGGIDRVAQKVGEEAVEVVIAAKNGNRAELAHEMANLWFHTFVLLAQQGMTPGDVWPVLAARRAEGRVSVVRPMAYRRV